MADMGTNVSFRDNLRNDGILVSNNPGTINVHTSDPERAETLPAPMSTVPFLRDPHFIHRDVLDDLSVTLERGFGRVALIGLGGVGKSQLAIEYACRLREESPDTWVLWLHASTAERLEQDVSNTLDELRIRGRKEPEANAFALLQHWLRNPKNGPWLIILDNVDDAQIIQDPPSKLQEDQFRKRRFDYIPSCGHGTVLVASRYRDVATKMVRPSAILKVGPMDEHDAVIMMKKKLDIKSAREDEEMIDLVRALSFMPLAISQAAAYIDKRAPRCSIPEYLRRFSEIIAAFNEDFEEEDDINRDSEARDSILATWYISMAHIIEVSETAVDLLSLMSFFDRQTIPEALLKPRGSQNGVSQHTSPAPSPDVRTGRTLAPNNHIRGPRQASSSTDGRAFEDDIQKLIEYSFISVTTTENTFEMHRLVQLATQRWLRDEEGHHQLSYWQGRFIKIIHDAFPTSWNAMSGNTDICHDLMPHASLAIAVQLIHPTKRVRLLQTELELRCAMHLFERGAYAESGRLATNAMEAFEQLLGPNEQDTGRAMKLLARVKRQQRKFDDAEELQLQICEREQEALGEEHPDTLMSMSHLAWLYLKQRRLEEARHLQVQTITLMKKTLPDTDGRVLFSMDRLAAIYVEMEQLNMAEQLQKFVLGVYTAKHGTTHIHTLTVMNNLSATYGKQERWSDAEVLQAKVLEGKKALLGDSHPSTLISMQNLAKTRRELGCEQSSMNLLQECVDKSVQALTLEDSNVGKRQELLEEWTREGARVQENGTGGEEEKAE